MKKLLTHLLTYSLFLSSAAHAAIDKNLVADAEKYLNSITGLSGGFTQISNGKTAKGEFFMLRPGRVRLDYKKLPVQMAADGKDLYFYDKSLDQITTVPMNSTPAGILVRKNIKLTDGDITVMETKEQGDKFSVKMQLKGNEGLGSMNVRFAKSPVKLDSWSVIDATGMETEVKFENLKPKNDFTKNFFQIQRFKTSGTSGDDFYQ